MRSLNTIEPIATVSAHTGGVTDFDVSNNLIITCGYTTR